MLRSFGIILLDADEVIIRIYSENEKGEWKLLRYQSHDLATFITGKSPQTSEIVEVIAQMALSQYGILVDDWKICARNISEEIVREVSLATNVKAEVLTLQREQELLCKGMILEF